MKPRPRSPTARFPGIPGPFVARPPTVDDDELEVSRKALEGGWDPVPDWLPETTRIVRVRRREGLDGAEVMAGFKAKYGRILQNLSDVRWWAARVYSRVPLSGDLDDEEEKTCL